MSISCFYHTHFLSFCATCDSFILLFLIHNIIANFLIPFFQIGFFRDFLLTDKNFVFHCKKIAFLTFIDCNKGIVN
ncbi:hypothetical protein P8452_58411 [Trifolium repens]|nr:hypothetical protein P8452_58411 [Trifolium repens]